MDFSSANASLWSGMLQLAQIFAVLLLANVLRRKIPLVRKSLLPTAVLAGFIVLLLRVSGLMAVDSSFMEMVTYHCLGLGFIAMALRVPEKTSDAERRSLIGLKSGALIASSYVIQALLGLAISLGLAYTVMPGMFKAAGILLPMGYGQGPGQANNIGITYENLGFAGGQSFGLSLAAAGFLCACIMGVIYLNVLRKQGKLHASCGAEVSGSVTIDTFQQDDEIPMAESVDRLSMNVALVLIIYGITYLVSRGLVAAISASGATNLITTISNLIWGFNFLIGTLLALLGRVVIQQLRRAKLMTRRYQNNYLLSRCSGAAFDLMVVAGLATINFEELSGLMLPFLLMAILGGFLTFFFLLWLCRRVYPSYYYAGFFSMFGMMTGTISSGVLLLREVDPSFATPAANNLLLGSGCAIIFGAPVLLLVGLAPLSAAMTWLTLAILAVYFVLLLLFMLKVRPASADHSDK